MKLRAKCVKELVALAADARTDGDARLLLLETMLHIHTAIHSQTLFHDSSAAAVLTNRKFIVYGLSWKTQSHIVFMIVQSAALSRKM